MSTVSRSTLTRKRAIMAVAIPKQISHFINTLQSPDWRSFSQSEAWKQTVENLQLTRQDQSDYRIIWEMELNKILAMRAKRR